MTVSPQGSGSHEPTAAKTLRLVIEFSGFYVEDIDPESDEFTVEEQAEDAMQLASEEVVVVFQGFEGDSPGTVLRSLEGRITKFGVTS